MRRYRFTAAICAAAVLIALFTGCAVNDGFMEVRVTYAGNNSAAGCGYVTRRIARATGERLCRMVLQLAMTPPAEEEYESVFPRKVSLKSVAFSEDGTVTVNYSADYSQLEGVSRTLADYCTVSTLFALGSVDGVKIQSVVILSDGEGDKSGLSPEDFIYNRDFLRLKEHRILLYYPEKSTMTLETDLYVVTLADTQDPAAAIMAKLSEGRREDGTIVSIIPENAQLLSITVKNRICYLDFSSGFYDIALTSQRETELRIFSIVNSLCGLDYVDRVQFLIGGERPEGAPIDLAEPISPEYGRAK